MSQLWLDLGNTRLKYWLMNGECLLDHDARLHLQAPAELLLGLSDKFMRLKPEFIGISSVLGKEINAQVTEILDTMGIAYEFANVNAAHPVLQSRYAPDQLGVDRWLQMLGVTKPAVNQCVIGCGTAMTLDVISDGVHLGGYIFPNARLQRQALYAGTQQIDVQTGNIDSTALATTTLDAVNHGILLSIVGAIHELHRAYPAHQFIATGGDAPIIARHLSFDVTIHQDLVLRGLKRYFAGRF
ncbi:pantothenate kinase [Moraxella caviae]|uniref:Type III pantothenate kinase n=1 Tax=Moraxella caviae TaxID=34060 RepID=A0A1T0A7M2_9GAMM|nr:type III pantothenate kinase [Moraxella caviae]OOR91321.1 pantothenate kinase [Moraxella caviae]STZ13927.1 Type III pantothenate kinase [Moraxella caviae]